MLPLVRADMQLECLATWKTGSEYLYGRLTGVNVDDDDDGLRCFVRDTFSVYCRTQPVI